MSIDRLALAPVYRLRLSAYGTRLCPVVGDSERVLRHQLLARGRVPLHAPTSGRVRHGRCGTMLHLDADGADAALPCSPLADWRSLAPEELIEAIGAAGIVGLGGAGFPAAEKLRAGCRRGMEVLIVNAVECEPGVSADTALAADDPDAVRAGIDALRRILAPERTLFAVAPDASPFDHDAMEVLVAPEGYPAGFERTLAEAAAGRRLARGEYPTDIGVYCQNVSTCHAIGAALERGTPLVERVVSVVRVVRAAAPARNLRLRAGHAVDDLCRQLGHHGPLRAGGPLTGAPLDAGGGIDKHLHAVTIDETTEALPCIRCGACAEACPESLRAETLYRLARAEHYDELEAAGLADCIECGACVPVCPSRIPLLDVFRGAKAAVNARTARRADAERAARRFAARRTRLDRRDARHTARVRMRKSRAPRSWLDDGS